MQTSTPLGTIAILPLDIRRLLYHEHLNLFSRLSKRFRHETQNQLHTRRITTSISHQEIKIALRRIGAILMLPEAYQVHETVKENGMRLLNGEECATLGLPADTYIVCVSFFGIGVQNLLLGTYPTTHYLTKCTKDDQPVLLACRPVFIQQNGMAIERKAIPLDGELDLYLSAFPTTLRMYEQLAIRILRNRLDDSIFVGRQYAKVVRSHLDQLLGNCGLTVELIVGQPLVDGTLTLDTRALWTLEQREANKKHISSLVPMTTFLDEHLVPLARNIRDGTTLPEQATKHQLSYQSTQHLAMVATAISCVDAYFLGYNDPRFMLSAYKVHIYNEDTYMTIATHLQGLPMKLTGIWYCLNHLIATLTLVDNANPLVSVPWCRSAYGFVVEAPFPIHDV